MSHITCMSQAIFDIPILLKALRELDLQYKYASKSTKTSKEEDLIILTDHGDIGIKQNDKTKDITFLTEKKHAKPQTEIVKQIRQKYTYIKIMAELKKNGYRLEKEETDKNNSVKLKFTKWD